MPGSHGGHDNLLSTGGKAYKNQLAESAGGVVQARGSLAQSIIGLPNINPASNCQSNMGSGFHSSKMNSPKANGDKRAAPKASESQAQKRVANAHKLLDDFLANDL